MIDQQFKLSGASERTRYVIASRSEFKKYPHEIGNAVCFFMGYPIDKKAEERWKLVQINEDAYSEGNFAFVGIERAFQAFSEKAAKEFCDELNRDVPEHDWVVLKYTKVEAFQEV